MATITRVQPKLVQWNPGHPRQYFGGPEAPEIVEASGQSYGVGDFLYLDGSGNVAIATVDGNANLNGQLAGQATAAYVGSGNNVHMRRLTRDCIFEMNVYHGTAASAITALTQVGQIYAVKKVSGIWVVDIESTAESATVKIGRVKVIGISKSDTLGDTYGRVLVNFVEQSEETDGGSHINVYQLD